VPVEAFNGSPLIDCPGAAIARDRSWTEHSRLQVEERAGRVLVVRTASS
jgi:hypothetical protein